MSDTVKVADFEDQIRSLGWTIRGASRFFGIGERTMRRWVAENEVARPVAMVLALMQQHPEIAEPQRLLELAGVDPDEVAEIVGKLGDQRAFMQDDES